MSKLNPSSHVDTDAVNQGVVNDVGVLLTAFFVGEWKKFVIALILGIALGFGYWLVLGSYSAVYVLNNNGESRIIDPGSSNSNSINIGLDLTSWKTLQKGLPLLASQLVQLEKVPTPMIGLYQSFSSNLWWQKNVTPVYGISKSDTKELTSISKEIDSAIGTIIGFEITIESSSREKAATDVVIAANFFRTAGAYLQIRRLLNGYAGIVIAESEDINRKITATKIEVNYKKRRLKFLQDLYKLYPVNYNSNISVLGAVGSDAKYFALPSQITAVSAEINRDEELLDRMNVRLDQLALIRNFIDQSRPLLDVQFDGILLASELLSIESKLRDQVEVGNLNKNLQLDEIRSQIFLIQARFTKGIEGGANPTIMKVGRLKAIITGVVTVTFLLLLFLICQKFWVSIKKRAL
ncbi:hypothetical protein [Polynucleobacter sp. AP-Feld-500C-C5]|uniref:hypothetical protein n=1 Tax=Polynucleobacter sp. AP-Feld-500C-C5 TaxID=2576924 RepID=UPI001C0E563B|nr:hypothetical protein [Polynucleobacter sp. AP-Feld-500C-C5]MBU3632860.1 hypothetical protein [Polynucleobacter sp. AP-Feld-500C-C5]